jgi:hypothetical protein
MYGVNALCRVLGKERQGTGFSLSCAVWQLEIVDDPLVF